MKSMRVQAISEYSGLRSAKGLPVSATPADLFSVTASRLNSTTLKASALNTEASAKLKVAINGFGRIGRNFVRCLETRENPPVEIVAVNQSGGVKPAVHLLKYDSLLGIFDADIKIISDDTFTVNGKPIKVVESRDPSKLPWAAMGVDIVIEGTGVFIDRPGASKHIQAGARRVIITAPAKGKDIPTYVVGVNDEEFDPTADIVSNASCTTNCLAPFVKVIDAKFGIVKGTMTTTHSYTGDQRLLDASHRDLRRARAAALNIVPTTTGAAKAVALVLPNMKGKLDGFAMRVPTPNVSVVDLVVNIEKKGLTAAEVNQVIRDEIKKSPSLANVLAVCDLPLVSVDFRKTDVSSTIDSSLTMVVGDDMLKIVAWYDNEWGYTQRVVDLTLIMANSLLNKGTPVDIDPLELFCKGNPDSEECKVYED